ncbi:BCCT family transporter [Staphylococcus pettenkoferi]|uniref:BCCT family transporter n=1 Tax=Staphylococcus pettenkoferi TaxID=170573 RepID=UPI000CD16660|nr:BCCT family transporter [Staphylococcus pettenkoferi]MCI2803433.1 BCCT family transporter [Staphylococcus pettenkoferi]MCY1573011.1 BCCT family transporter [Staphylococcus pettenkoferi]MCY1579025.1 BCCT family transporter [Staphylococcus pettenkoferi]MCY1615772.1 BCCT family transporter [Staphylococcus pettenkoferi]MCY1626910.1 BCCT family transporter [Staphylococcus pettenkoferi]
MQKKKLTIVFWVALAICTAFVMYGAILPKQLEKYTQNITNFIAVHFGWYYLLLVLAILVICVYLLFSRFSSITLGEEGEDPEFSLKSWFAMLFSAGMGIGLVFWTTAEPISHAFTLTPIHKAGTQSAINDAMQFAFFHWGIHAWAVYGIVALVFAYFNFHKGYPGLVSATLVPVFGQRLMRGPLGGAVDVLAIIATVTGVAATLGFGALQINEGLHYLFHAPSNFGVQVIIIIIATILFTWSAWSGIDKGIKNLSNINMILAFVVLVVLFCVGPTLQILNTFTNSLGNYIANFFNMSLRIPQSGGEKFQWMQNWTIFYWAWWVSWAPFVGIFIARVSRGRTIKEFILGVLFVPALVCFLFFAVFGATAIYLQEHHIANIAKEATETATFATLEHFPLGFILSIVTLVVIMIFFVTSADSATYVLGMLSSKGDINPSSFVKVSWGVILALFAMIMIYTGGTQSIQNLLIIAALPFSVVIIFMIWGLFKALSHEKPRTHQKILGEDYKVLHYRKSDLEAEAREAQSER